MSGTTRRWIGWLGAGALAVALGAGAAHAQPGPAGAQGGRGVRVLRAALSTLDLTQDQKDRILHMMQDQKPAVQALREKAKADRQALKAALEVANPDPATVGAAFLKVHANRQAMKDQLQKLHQSLATVLTPDQQAKLDGYLAALKHMRGRGPRGPQG